MPTMTYPATLTWEYSGSRGTPHTLVVKLDATDADVRIACALLDGQPLKMPPQVMRTLLFFALNHGDTTDEHALRNHLYAERERDRRGLKVYVSLLRKRLDDHNTNPAKRLFMPTRRRTSKDPAFRTLRAATHYESAAPA